ncbi:hypothetical protein Tco_1007103, partial [Tanacetum coccineum]
MRTRSSLEYTIPRRRNRRRSRQQQEAIPLIPDPIPMADDRPMAEQLQAPTGGFERGNDEEPHAHIRHFESITNNQRYPDVPNTTIKLLLFPFSLDGVAKTWLDKEPPNSILTWDDLVSNLGAFQGTSKEVDLSLVFRFMPQLDTFYIPLSYNDKILLIPLPVAIFSTKPLRFVVLIKGNSGTLLTSVASIHKEHRLYSTQVPKLRRPNQWIQWNQSIIGLGKVNQTNQVNHGANLGLNQQAQAYQAPSTQVPVTYSRFEAYIKANDATLTNLQKNLNDFKREQNEFQNEQRNFQRAMMSFMQNSGNNGGSNHASTSGTLPSNTVPNPRNERKGITTRSGVVLDGPLPSMPLVRILKKWTKTKAKPTQPSTGMKRARDYEFD